ncbi:hypothetical protein Bca101_001807 [Brassica carinata]
MEFTINGIKHFLCAGDGKSEVHKEWKGGNDFRAMRNFDYGVTAVQESKRVENAMLREFVIAGEIEDSDIDVGIYEVSASKTRRELHMGRCVISEKTTRRNFIWVAISGEGHEAWFNSSLEFQEAKVNVALSVMTEKNGQRPRCWHHDCEEDKAGNFIWRVAVSLTIEEAKVNSERSQ